MTTDPTEWTPGIPLYERGAHPHSLYIYCFRDDSAGDHCDCQDRADWPSQLLKRIPDGDEIGRFIAEVRGEAAS